MTDTIREKGHAKINLCLDVIKKNDDGYHEVSMIMQELELCDDIVLTKINNGIEIVLQDERGIIADELSEVPTDERNIAYKAAALLIEKYGLTEGVKIELTKRIPAAAGLAGGSADASAVLRGMNRLFELGVSTEELCVLGKKLGADIPYCIKGGTCLAEGIGEKLTEIGKMQDYHVLLVKPKRGVSTKEVYEGLHVNERKSYEHPNTKICTAAINDGNMEELFNNMGNILELVTSKYVREIKDIEKVMQEEGAVKAMMSGSGPTVFGIFSDRKKMHRAYEQFNTERWQKIISDAIETKIKN